MRFHNLLRLLFLFFTEGARAIEKGKCENDRCWLLLVLAPNLASILVFSTKIYWAISLATAKERRERGKYCVDRRKTVRLVRHMLSPLFLQYFTRHIQRRTKARSK